MMNDFLFADFLEDHAAYAVVEAYWRAREKVIVLTLTAASARRTCEEIHAWFT